MGKIKKKIEIVGLCYNGVDLPYTISTDGKIYDGEGKQLHSIYNKKFGYRVQIVYKNKSTTISVARALLESFRGSEGSSKEVNLKYLDGDNSNINLDNLMWQHKTVRNSKTGSRLYDYSRSSMESALRILSGSHGSVESAVKQSRLTVDQIRDIVTSQKYRPIRAGYNIKLCKERLNVY